MVQYVNENCAAAVQWDDEISGSRGARQVAGRVGVILALPDRGVDVREQAMAIFSIVAAGRLHA
jgi:hypothetical protein